MNPLPIYIHLATFLLPGIKCHHRVLVLLLRGPCMEFHHRNRIPLASRISAAKQLLIALGSLHKAGIIHRGK
jgi:serine/threonine protein kinase